MAKGPLPCPGRMFPPFYGWPYRMPIDCWLASQRKEKSTPAKWLHEFRNFFRGSPSSKLARVSRGSLTKS
eukprot:1152573-Pelagomonas_calceolata.AAC.2